MVEAVQRPGWRWDLWARVVRHDDLDIVLSQELLDAIPIQDERHLERVLLRYEQRASTASRDVSDLNEVVVEVHCPVVMQLTSSEANLILALAESGSFPSRQTASSALAKISKALIDTDPGSHVRVACTAEEAEFIARTRLA